MTHSKHRNIDSTIDFLITDAKVRLKFERIRAGKPVQSQREVISFIPLAAAGVGEPKDIELYSQDHNFKAVYQIGENLYCDLQAQGYAAIEKVKEKQLPLCFEQQHLFLASFNEHGFARVELPNNAPDQRHWWLIPFNIIL